MRRRRRNLLHLLPLLLAAAGACDSDRGAHWASTELLLVPHAVEGEGVVLGIDAASNSVLRRWSFLSNGGDVAVSPDGLTAAVLGAPPVRRILAIDLRTGRERLLSVPAGRQLIADLVLADSMTLLLATGDPAGVLVMDVRTGSEIAFIPAPEGQHASRVTALGRSHDGRRVWALELAENRVLEVDVERRAIVAVVEDDMTSIPLRITASRDGSRLWSVSGQGGVVSRDPATGIGTTVLSDLGFPYRLTFSRDGATAFLSYNLGVIRAYDADTGGRMAERRLDGTINGLALSHRGDLLYVSIQETGDWRGDSTFFALGPGAVVALDPSTLEERGRITTGRFPLGVTAAGPVPR